MDFLWRKEVEVAFFQEIHLLSITLLHPPQIQKRKEV